jgi:hypothetical protein
MLRPDLFALFAPALKNAQVDFFPASLHFHNRQRAARRRAGANDNIALPQSAGHRVRELYVVLDGSFGSQSLFQQRDHGFNGFPVGLKLIDHIRRGPLAKVYRGEAKLVA